MDVSQKENVTLIADDNSWILLSLTTELNRDGGNPSHLLDLLYEAVKRRVWEDQGITFFEFLTSPYPTGIDSNERNIRLIIQLKHKFEKQDKAKAQEMEWLRQEVGQLLDGTLGDVGDNQYNGCSALTPKLDQRGESEPYIRARLKRDHKKLYEQVVRNELTATAAGQRAGFIPKRQKFVVGDVEQTVKQIKKYFTPEEIRGLVELLQT